MKGLTFQNELSFLPSCQQFARGDLGVTGIQPITQDRAADMGQVDSNLVSSTGLRGHSDQGVPRETFTAA